MREYDISNCCDFAAFVNVLNNMLVAGEIYGYSYDNDRNKVRVYFHKEAVRV